MDEYLHLIGDGAHWAFELTVEATTTAVFAGLVWVSSRVFKDNPFQKWFNRRWVRADNALHGHTHRETR